MPFESPIAHRFHLVEAPADWIVVADSFFDDGADGADVDSFANLFGRRLVGEFGVDLDARVCVAPADAEDPSCARRSLRVRSALAPTLT